MYFHHPLYEEEIRAASAAPWIPWEELEGASLLVTGATGLIGTCLIDLLMEHNRESGRKPVEIWALGRSRERLRRRFADYEGEAAFHFLIQDICTPLPPDRGFSYIINGASNAHPAAYSSDPVGTILTNVQGLSSLLAHAVQHGTRRVLEISSVEIYGQNRGDAMCFSEEYCGNIDCNTVRAGYPESKRVCEALCQAYRKQYGLAVCIARPSRVYGPTMLEADNKATAQFIRHAVQGENIVLKSSGKQRYSYTYALDAATAFLTILLRGEDGEAYNIADSRSTLTLMELAEKAAHLGSSRVIHAAASPTEDAGFSHLENGVMDAGKLQALGWRAATGIDDGLSRTVRILREEN